MINTQEISDFCSKYINGFEIILNPSKFGESELSNYDKEIISKNGIKCIGQILTTNTVVTRNINLYAFSHKNFTFIEFLYVLRNMIDLPILYPKSIRICAIKQIGNIVRRIGISHNEKLLKFISQCADDFYSKLTSFANMSYHYECAYIMALGKLAINPQIQDLLLKVIETMLKNLDTYELSTKLSIFKASQYCTHPSKEMLEFYTQYSQNKSVHLSLSTYASLNYVQFSIKLRKQLYFTKLLEFVTSKKVTDSNDETVIRPALKLIHLIAFNSPEDLKQCINFLFDQLNSKNAICKDRIYYTLTKIVLRFDKSNMIAGIFETGLLHIKKALANNYNIKSKVINAVSLIVLKYNKYSQIVYPQYQEILEKKLTLPRSIFDVLISGINLSKKKIEDLESDINNMEDIFESSKDDNMILPEESNIIYKWRKSLNQFPNLLNIDLLQSNQIGYSSYSSFTTSTDQIVLPKKLYIFEDIVCCFIIACSDIFKLSLTLPTLKNHILDKTKEDRNIITFENLCQLMEPINMVNYVQLLFSLFFKPKTCDSPILVKVLAELQFMTQYLKKRNAEKNSKRVVSQKNAPTPRKTKFEKKM